ncbi:MAG: M20 family metallopeptidase [Candidatus Tectomicrobia bacterium]|nr:M20 family metallopeptidase [Candidatus Tectomicrobia bacterium]
MKDAVLTYLRQHEGEMFALLERFVRVDSGSYEKRGVDQMGDLLSEELSQLGFQIETIREESCGNHLLAKRGGDGHGRLFLSCHLDTVTRPHQFSDGPFLLRGREAHGAGVADMKGGVVQMLFALKALQAVGAKRLPSITIFATGDEELGSVRGRPYIEREGKVCNWALVVEPGRSDGSYVSERWSLAVYYLTIHGFAVHMGDPQQKGINANLDLAHKIIALEGLTDEEKGVKVGVNLIQGGISRQTVAPTATAHIDVRARTQPLMDELIPKVEAICRTTYIPGVEMTLTGGVTRPAMEKHAATEQLFQLVTEVGQEVGIEVKSAATRGGGDGSFVAQLGVPTIDGMGPIGHHSCTTREYIEIESCVPRTAVIALTIARLS